jgi:hypothetical protein
MDVAARSGKAVSGVPLYDDPRRRGGQMIGMLSTVRCLTFPRVIFMPQHQNHHNATHSLRHTSGPADHSPRHQIEADHAIVHATVD